MVPLPPWLHLWLQETNDERNSAFLMFNLPDKCSQQRKAARYCRIPTKSNIVSSGCYVWLLSTRLPANRDFLL